MTEMEFIQVLGGKICRRGRFVFIARCYFCISIIPLNGRIYINVETARIISDIHGFLKGSEIKDRGSLFLVIQRLAGGFVYLYFASLVKMDNNDYAVYNVSNCFMLF